MLFGGVFFRRVRLIVEALFPVAFASWRTDRCFSLAVDTITSIMSDRVCSAGLCCVLLLIFSIPFLMFSVFWLYKAIWEKTPCLPYCIWEEPYFPITYLPFPVPTAPKKKRKTLNTPESFSCTFLYIRIPSLLFPVFLPVYGRSGGDATSFPRRINLIAASAISGSNCFPEPTVSWVMISSSFR